MIASSGESRQSFDSFASSRNAPPRFLDAVVGRVLELMVLSVESIRERLLRPTAH